MTFYYVIALLLAFYLFLIAEFFLPTGGLLGFAAAAALIATLVIAFTHSLATGVTVLFIVLLTTPLVLSALVRLWPHTPIGRRMLNRRPGEVAMTAARTTSRGTPIDELVGRIGVAKTVLLPSGIVVIDGEKIDAVSIGMPIDSGAKIIVTSTQAGRVQVRIATDEDHVDEDAERLPQSPPGLEQSLESLDFD